METSANHPILKRINFAKSCVMVSICLLLLSRPVADLGFNLNPSYCLLLLLPIAVRYRHFALYKHEILLALFYAYCFISVTYSHDQAASLRFIAGACLLVTFFFINKAFISNINLEDFFEILTKIGKIYCLTSFVAYAIGIINLGNLAEHDLYAGLLIDRSIPRMTGLSFDPNIFALTLIPFVFLFMTSGKTAWFIFSFTLLLLSFSRGGWIAFFMGFLFLLLFGFNRKRLFCLIITLAATVIVWFSFRDSIINFVASQDNHTGSISANIANIDIIESIEKSDAGSGRLEIWRNAWELFTQKPVFGWGIFSFRSLNQEFFGIDKFGHNTYLDILSETGIVGLLIFISFISTLIFAAIRIARRHQDFEFLLPTAFSLVIGIFFLSLYINNVFLFFLILFSAGFSQKGQANGS